MAFDSHIDASGSLTSITGPMRSGKTDKLKAYLRLHDIAGHRVLLIGHGIDTRTAIDGVYTTGVLTSHNEYGGDLPPSILQLKVKLLKSVDSTLIESYDVIAIDEGQFFDDIEVVLVWLLEWNKTLYVSGLKSTDKGTPFGNLYKLDGFVTKEHKLKALCKVCQHEFNHLTYFFPATMVKCLVEKSGDVLVGADNYISVCLRHWKMSVEDIQRIMKTPLKNSRERMLNGSE